MTDRLQLVITELALLGAGVFLLAKGERETGWALCAAAVGGGGFKSALSVLPGAAPEGPQVPPPAPTAAPPASAMPPRSGAA